MVLFFDYNVIVGYDDLIVANNCTYIGPGWQFNVFYSTTADFRA